MKKVLTLLSFLTICATAFASDKLAGGIKSGSTSVSLPVELRKSADSTELTGKVHSDVTGSYWRQGGTRTAITMATLGSVNATYSSGGFVEVDATNIPGLYRFDVPDAAFATGADWVVITVKVSTAFVRTFMFALESSGASELSARLPAALTADGNIKSDALRIGGTTQTGRDIGTSVLLSPGTGTGQISLSSGAVTVATNNDKTGYSLAADQAVNATKWAGVAVTGMPMPTYTQPTGFLSATFPSGTIANTTNITAGTLTTVTTATNLINFPAAPTDWLTAAAVKADAVTKIQSGLSSQTSVDDIPTNAELATALGTADDATLSAISGLNNLSQANVRTAVGLAASNLDTQLDALPTAAENGTATWATATRALTDKANFTLASTYDAAKTAAQAGDAMTLTSGERISIGTATWATTTRALTDKASFTLTSAYDPAKVDIWNVTLSSSAYTGQKAGALLWKIGNRPNN